MGNQKLMETSWLHHSFYRESNIDRDCHCTQPDKKSTKFIFSTVFLILVVVSFLHFTLVQSNPKIIQTVYENNSKFRIESTSDKLEDSVHYDKLVEKLELAFNSTDTTSIRSSSGKNQTIQSKKYSTSTYQQINKWKQPIERRQLSRAIHKVVSTTNLRNESSSNNNSVATHKTHLNERGSNKNKGTFSSIEASFKPTSHTSSTFGLRDFKERNGIINYGIHNSIVQGTKSIDAQNHDSSRILTQGYVKFIMGSSNDKELVSVRTTTSTGSSIDAGSDTFNEPHVRGPRIVGGTPIEKGQYPYFVFTSGTGLCGGTLIWSDIVLTAAHCANDWISGAILGATLINASDFDAYSEVIQEVPHPDYTRGPEYNDIMLVQLKDAYPNGPFATLNFDSNIPTDGNPVTVIGFGRTTENGTISDTLLGVTVNVYNSEVCNITYGGIDSTIQICAGTDAGGKDSCQGDSGGPLFTSTNVQVGIVSFGVGCARPDKPAVYVRVSAYQQWMSNTICSISAAPPPDCFITPTQSPSSIQTPVVPRTVIPTPAVLVPTPVIPTPLPLSPSISPAVIPISISPVSTNAPVKGPNTLAPASMTLPSNIIPTFGNPSDPGTNLPSRSSPIVIQTPSATMNPTITSAIKTSTYAPTIIASDPSGYSSFKPTSMLILSIAPSTMPPMTLPPTTMFFPSPEPKDFAKISPTPIHKYNGKIKGKNIQIIWIGAGEHHFGRDKSSKASKKMKIGKKKKKKKRMKNKYKKKSIHLRYNGGKKHSRVRRMMMMMRQRPRDPLLSIGEYNDEGHIYSTIPFDKIFRDPGVDNDTDNYASVDDDGNKEVGDDNMDDYEDDDKADYDDNDYDSMAKVDISRMMMGWRESYQTFLVKGSRYDDQSNTIPFNRLFRDPGDNYDNNNDGYKQTFKIDEDDIDIDLTALFNDDLTGGHNDNILD